MSSQVQLLPPPGVDCALPAGEDPISSVTSPAVKNEQTSIAGPAPAVVPAALLASVGWFWPSGLGVPPVTVVLQPVSRSVAIAKPTRPVGHEVMKATSAKRGVSLVVQP